uniref:HPF/RaiA family ribosome-associated protein n=1 Tax=Aromatoleum buckelii TaxID=200254 RepID=A0ABX1N726_9RHOO
MRIDLQCSGLEAPSGLRDYVARRMRFAIGRFRDQIQWARIKVADVNGPRGGADKRCVVQLRLRNCPDVIFSVTGTDARPVVDLAAERVSQVLVRRLARLRQFSREAASVPDPVMAGT